MKTVTDLMTILKLNAIFHVTASMNSQHKTTVEQYIFNEIEKTLKTHFKIILIQNKLLHIRRCKELGYNNLK